MFRTFAIGSFGVCYAFTDPESLSLLQLQARRDNVTDKQCPTTNVGQCGGVGDTHIVGTVVGNFDLQTPGVMPMATHCNGDHIQFYQCWWDQRHVTKVSGVRGYAAKFGDTVVRVFTQSGLVAKVCIDSLDGCQSLDHYVGHEALRARDVMIQRYQTGVRVERPSTGWAVWHQQSNVGREDAFFDAWLKAPGMRSDSRSDVCLGGRNYPSIQWQGVDNANTPDYDAMLFTAEDAQGWCDTCRWSSAAECKKPPPAPPPPKPEAECRESGVTYSATLDDGSPDPDSAVGCCSPVEGDPVLYKECLFDACMAAKEGVRPPVVDKDVCIAYQLVEGSSGRPICLTEKATADCPKPPAIVCKNSAKLDLTKVTENTLEQPGGRLVYGEAGSINGVTVDVVVTAADGYQPFLGGDSANGNEGEFGTIIVSCGTSADLTFNIFQTGTDVPVAIEQATLTYYDLDEGKRGKGRMSVETCDQDETILAENTELSQVVRGTCVTATSSKKGSKDDNPTSLMELTDIQRARAVTYSFSKLSTWNSKVSLAAGSGGRGFLFSLQPAEACRPGANLAVLGWVPPQPGDPVVPEDRKECTIGGCPVGKGCCMDASTMVAQSWAKPNRRIRDTCLTMPGFSWCTGGNRKQTAELITTRDGGLNFAQRPAMSYLMKLGLFGGNGVRLNQPLREEEGVVNAVAFPALAKFEAKDNQCIGKRLGRKQKCSDKLTFNDEACLEQAAVACNKLKECTAFAFLVKGGKFALGTKPGRKSKGCKGWSKVSA